MRQSAILSGLFIVTFVGVVHAQNGVKEADLEHLNIPSAPAANIMGEQPMEITRPKNMAQLESSLLSNFSDGANLVLPDGVAIEFMPYWLKPNPNHAYNRATDAKNQCRPLQNLAISIATINRMQGDSIFRSQVGFGFRTLLFTGKMSTKDLNELDALHLEYVTAANPKNAFGTAMANLTTNPATRDLSDIENTFCMDVRENGGILKLSDETILTLIDWAKNEFNIIRQNSPGPTTGAAVLALLAARVNSEAASSTGFFGAIQKESAAIAKQSEALRVKRYGWRWEIAGATFIDFPTQEISYSKVPKLGLWSNVSYTVIGGNIQFIFLSRYVRDFHYLHQEGDGEGANSLDFGGSLVWDIGKFSIAGEGIYRNTWYREVKGIEDGSKTYKLTSAPDYRVALNISYQLSEKVLISYSFGKALGPSNNNGSPLVNQLSINLGFGDVPIKL